MNRYIIIISCKYANAITIAPSNNDFKIPEIFIPKQSLNKVIFPLFFFSKTTLIVTIMRDPTASQITNHTAIALVVRSLRTFGNILVPNGFAHTGPPLFAL